MILHDLFESHMSDLDIEYQDWKNLSPVAFHSRYKMTKDQWYAKHASLVPAEGVAEGFAEHDLRRKLQRQIGDIELIDFYITDDDGLIVAGPFDGRGEAHAAFEKLVRQRQDINVMQGRALIVKLAGLREGVWAGGKTDPLDTQAQAVAAKLCTDKNLAKLNAMAYDSTIYRALDRYFDKHGLPENIYNRVAHIVFKKLDDTGRRLTSDPRLQDESVAEAVSDETVKKIQGLFKQAKTGKLKSDGSKPGDWWSGPKPGEGTPHAGHGMTGDSMKKMKKPVKEAAQKVDMTGKKCTHCGKGSYKETSIHDDMDGVLHCAKCNHEVTRWQTKSKPAPTTYHDNGTPIDVKEDWKAPVAALATVGALAGGVAANPDLEIDGKRYQKTTQHALSNAPADARTVTKDGKTYKVWSVRSGKHGARKDVYAEVKPVKEGADVAYIVSYFDTKTGDKGESTVSALTQHDARDKIVELMHERGYDVVVTGVRSATPVDEGSQRFGKHDPYWVCVNGNKWKRFDTYEHARAVHDRLEKKLRDEGSDKKVSLLPAESELEEGNPTSDPWIVYDKANPNKIKKFKTRDGAKAFADKHGYGHASFGFYHDNVKPKGVKEGLRDPKDNPCWKGYKPVGTKQKAGRTVPNCVPKK